MEKSSELETFLSALHWILVSFSVGSFLGYMQGENSVQERLDNIYLFASDYCKSEMENAEELKNDAMDEKGDYYR